MPGSTVNSSVVTSVDGEKSQSMDGGPLRTTKRTQELKVSQKHNLQDKIHEKWG